MVIANEVLAAAAPLWVTSGIASVKKTRNAASKKRKLGAPGEDGEPEEMDY